MAATYPSKLPPSPKSGRRPRHLIRRGEPGLLPAAILAIVMHSAFFAIIFFGVSWQVKQPAPVAAELWSQLPPTRNVIAPPPEADPAPVPLPERPPVAPPVEKSAPLPSRADVDLKEKREREVLAKKQLEQELLEKTKRDEAKAVEKKKLAEEEKKRRTEEAKQKLAAENLRKEQEFKENAVRAERNAALAEFKERLNTLIDSRTDKKIMDNVTGKPKIGIQLRLLVNGKIFDAKIINPSGNAVYDAEMERTINSIQIWPQPRNAELFAESRTLTLNIEHIK